LAEPAARTAGEAAAAEARRMGALRALLLLRGEASRNESPREKSAMWNGSAVGVTGSEIEIRQPR
jgi:hypothetical protein